MSDWEQAAGSKRQSTRRVAGAVLLLAAAGGWLAYTGDRPAPDEADGVLVETGDETGSGPDDADPPAPGPRPQDEEPGAEGREGSSGADGIALQLLLTDDHALTTIDLSSGHTERVALDEVSGGDPPFRLTRRGDAVVFYGRGGSTYAAHPAAPDQPWRLGTSVYYVPSAHPERVWLVDRRSRLDPHFRVREVAIDGEVTADWIDVPVGTRPRAAVSSGLVLIDEDRLRVWDPDSGEDVAVLDGPFLAATSGDRVAWCDQPCEVLRVTDIAAGVDSRLDVPARGDRWRPHHSSFSTSGDLLAVHFGVAAEQDDPADGANGLAIMRALPDETVLARVLPTASEPGGPPVWSPSDHYMLAPARGGDFLLHERDAGVMGDLGMELPTQYGAVAFYEMAGGFGGQRPRGPVPVEGLVLSITSGGPAEVRAVEAASGQVRWTREIDDYPALGPTTEDAVLVARLTEVLALDRATGEEQWNVSFELPERPGAPTVADGTVYLPTSVGPHYDAPPRVRALDATTGEIAWSSALSPGTDLQWAAPVVTGDLVLVVDTPSYPGSAGGATLHALDRATGEGLWTFGLRHSDAGFHHEPPLFDGDRVVVAGSGGLWAVDARSGEELWGWSFMARPRHLRISDGSVGFRVGAQPVRLDLDTGETLEVDGRP